MRTADAFAVNTENDYSDSEASSWNVHSRTTWKREACDEHICGSHRSLVTLAEDGYRTYISEPDRGRRKWKDKEDAQQVTYANRRRIRGEHGKRLLRQRGELLERPFAHYLEAGGMRRTHLRHHPNILKRLLVHVAGFNLGILMRNLIGTATPKEYADLLGCMYDVFARLLDRILSLVSSSMIIRRVSRAIRRRTDFATVIDDAIFTRLEFRALSTGC